MTLSILTICSMRPGLTFWLVLPEQHDQHQWHDGSRLKQNIHSIDDAKEGSQAARLLQQQT